MAEPRTMDIKGLQKFNQKAETKHAHYTRKKKNQSKTKKLFPFSWNLLSFSALGILSKSIICYSSGVGKYSSWAKYIACLLFL